MELKDLLGKPVDELSVDELEFKIREMKKLKVMAVKTSNKKTTKSTPKSNKDKQLASKIKALNPEQLKLLMQNLKENKYGSR